MGITQENVSDIDNLLIEMIQCEQQGEKILRHKVNTEPQGLKGQHQKFNICALVVSEEKLSVVKKKYLNAVAETSKLCESDEFTNLRS